MGYMNNLFSGQSETSGVSVSETSNLLSIHSIAGHPAVYRHLKTVGKVDVKQQKQSEF